MEFSPALADSAESGLVGSAHPTSDAGYDGVEPAMAESGAIASPTEDPNAGLRIPPAYGEGLPIEQVFVYLRNPTGDPAQDEAWQQQITDTFGIRAGANFSPLFADQGLNQVQRLPFVESAEYRLYESNRPGAVILALLVTLQPAQAEASLPPPTGMAVSGNFGDFPTIYQSDRSLVKFLFNGGLGIFSDTNPWFGNADSFAPGPYEPTGTITWGEAYLEPGVAGITRLGNWPLYVYGAGSYLLSASVQPDI
ncbi:MAG TPA: hypothetical protein V6D02_10410, partial [Candidatus Obscuribacterales bacterium]